MNIIIVANKYDIEGAGLLRNFLNKSYGDYVILWDPKHTKKTKSTLSPIPELAYDEFIKRGVYSGYACDGEDPGEIHYIISLGGPFGSSFTRNIQIDFTNIYEENGITIAKGKFKGTNAFIVYGQDKMGTEKAINFFIDNIQKYIV